MARIPKVWLGTNIKSKLNPKFKGGKKRINIEHLCMDGLQKYVLMCIGTIGTDLRGVPKFPGAARRPKG